MSTIAADAILGRRTPSVKKPGILRKKGKSSNEYERSGSGAYSKRSFKEGNVTVKQDEDVFFDIKV